MLFWVKNQVFSLHGIMEICRMSGPDLGMMPPKPHQKIFEKNGMAVAASILPPTYRNWKGWKKIVQAKHY